MFPIRLSFVTVIRFILFILLSVFAANFEVSPLPAWTLIVFVYLLHFLITWFATRWVYRGHGLTNGKTTAVAVVFTLGEFLLESGLFLVLTGWDFASLSAGFTWKALILFVIYLVAIALAIWQIRKHRAQVMANLTPTPPTPPMPQIQPDVPRS